MDLNSILDTTRSRVTSAAGTAARSGESLVRESAVVATGQTGPTSPGVEKNAAPAAGVIVLVALGILIGMRALFKGAIG